LSVFLRIAPAQWVASNDLAFAIRDGFPVSPGHTLVITKRVVPDWFSATPEEQRAVFALVDAVKRALDELEPKPDGYNVGFNAGEAAGQTVAHLHVHVIPRYRGDMDDPRGGVRHVIPSRGNYLRRVAPLAVGGTEDPFARHLTPLFREASDIAIVAAFIQESGLKHIVDDVHAALLRGARVRILTGDYLDITQASALEMLLDWQETSGTVPDEDDDERDEASTTPARFEARIIEVERLPRPTTAFHPKSWRFEASSFGVAFVGSSNISRSALATGIEWNLRVDRDRDAEAYGLVREAFENLWKGARAIDGDWIAAYARRARERAAAPLLPVGPVGEDEPEPLEAPPEPHAVQEEALAALRASREAGRLRALVVLATGLGKTWLAAFDFEQFVTDHASSARLGARRPRLLFVAHRRELLRQAAHTFRRLLRKMAVPSRVGWFVGSDGDLSADIVFASVAKLARPQNLASLREQPFDYVVIDEVHHAAADSYRKILEAVNPRFLLGLTATPDRADEADVLGLFDDHVAYRADIPRGVAVGRLVPFHYFGVKDEIDYDNIPWRNRRFDPAMLESALQTEERMRTLWRAWSAHPGTRTLVFCASISHANFVKRWLAEHDVRIAAVYAAAGSDDRDEAIARLERGELDALCSVDVFNEGVDVPSVDRVVMLRPTESSVIFLQQLGRGLRASPGKASVSVIDFVGNHRVFLERLRTLLSLGGSSRATPVRDLLEADRPVELPAGCSVDLELEAKDLLSRLFKAGGASEVERVYRELRESRGERPTAGEMDRLGHLPSTLRTRYGSWFGFVQTEGDLKVDEGRLLAGAGGAFLRELETTAMTKCFKMVTVQALLDAEAFEHGLPLTELAERAYAILRRSPELFEDVTADLRKPSLSPAETKAFLAYWRRNPVEAWTGEAKDRRAWFRLEGDRFVPAFAVADADRPALERLAREMVEYRLAQYRARQRQGVSREDGFVCRVTWNQRDPILKLPAVREHVPNGETDVRVDGGVWTFNFAKQFCNVAIPAGAQRNQLPDLLRRWFGPTAGQPGTAFEVRFYASPDGLWAEPQGGRVIELSRNAVIAYPDLQAAAGHGEDVGAADVRGSEVRLPLSRVDPDLFAVRVAGTSMDGGKSPLRDGDWAVMRLARGAAPSSLRDRVVLVRSPGDGDGMQYQIKRLAQQAGAWRLTSDNPEGPSFEATDANTVIARLEESFHPEDLGPPVGTVLAEQEAAAAFGLDEIPTTSGRAGGHLMVIVDRKGMLVAPDFVREPSVTPRSAETAFVLARRPDGHLRYLGVGRWVNEEQGFRIPHADFATWRAWGEGRLASRDLPDGALGRAQVLVDELLAQPEAERWISHPSGKRARVLGPSARGGVRISGGEGGFEERTVSLVDLAWVVTAADDAQAKGELLDEARVNRLRYLEGTPKGSTRWIDTGWALGIWTKTSSRVRKAAGGASEPRKPLDDSGREVDATFSVEPVGTGLSLVFESRGGTRGSKDERNTEYAEGLRLLLERLGTRGYRLADAQVISRETATLSSEELRLIVEEMPYPIRITDADAARRKLSSAIAKVGRAPGAKGAGNSTKRIRLWLEGPEATASELAGWLAARAPAPR
jgi:superfamily II DNA or RNA helicase/diadenosine tetraphosphate (Ap4A) HIT family hydrolase